MGRMRPVLAVIATASVVLLVASCASSRVVRGPSSSRSVRSSPPPVRVSTPRYGATAVVQRGDTIYHIATVNGITALDLALWNGIPPPYTIYPGQRLRLYPGAAPVVRSTTPSRTVPSTPSAPMPPPAVSTPVNAPFAWRWPTDGSLVESFAAGDPTRQGIDIAGNAGQPVRAAADGVVVYSGSGLVGYGELIIVKHNDQWLSAYGHNRARLVNEGQLVKAGQQIAEMGRSGAARDMLHFEIRYNGKPVDPQAFLPKK
ncbi:peptidoglycan DD-metalloendopeptidase family protein [Pseudoluteimonas lycopersici]|nr:peptidoglycan DD-metalloendopeptidase family protein [Lysobacter lycopersici]